jgi:hypothetical protein
MVSGAAPAEDDRYRKARSFPEHSGEAAMNAAAVCQHGPDRFEMLSYGAGGGSPGPRDVLSSVGGGCGLLSRGGVFGPGELAVARRYLRVSRVELPAGVSAARAEGWLAGVVAGAAAGGHPAAVAAGLAGGGGGIGLGLGLLGGLVREAGFVNAGLSGGELDCYRPGGQVRAGGLVVAGFDPPGLSGGQNTRFVVLPLAGRGGRFASAGRDGSLLLGYGAAVFPPGTAFTVRDRYSADGVTAVMLAETPAAAAGPVRLEDVVPVTGPGTLGLNESLHRYVYRRAVEAELGRWLALEPRERRVQGPVLMERLLAAVNGRLAAIGVPGLAPRVGVAGAGAFGAFDAGSWQLGAGVVPADREGALLAASTFWHEARHAEQYFLALAYLAAERPGLLTPGYTDVCVPGVLRAARGNPAAPGSAGYVAGRHWHSVLYGDGFGGQRAAAERCGVLYEAVRESGEAVGRAVRGGAGQAELGGLRQAARAARQRYVQEGYLPFAGRPEERDAYGAEVLVMPAGRGLLPEPAPGGEPVFCRQVGVWEQRRVRLGLGAEPGAAADVLVCGLGYVAVVHGRGRDGRLRVGGAVADGAWLGRQLGAVADPGDAVVLLASDSQVAAQELADARQGRVWAPPPRGEEAGPAEVWVSLGTGAVAVGWGDLDGQGRLQITAVPLHPYQPRSPGGGGGQPGGPQAGGQAPAGDDAVEPVRVLTGEQALADPGPWQRRTAPVPDGPRDEAETGCREAAQFLARPGAVHQAA